MPTVNAQNWTTLYSATAQQITPQQPYGNANVEHFLNVGTDGGNTVQNILANGQIIANGNITTNDFFVGDGGYISNIVSTTATTANFANYAGNVTNSAQPNITSVGTLVNVTATGNITSTTGVFVGNGAGLTNLNVSNITGNPNFANFAGNVTNSAQPNITSVGTLVNVTVTGNITSTSGIFNGDGYGLSNISVGNITGNPNFANFAGNVTNSAQPNITSVGTLVNVTATGNITSTSGIFNGDGYGLSNISISNITGNPNFANFAGNVTNSAQPNITSVGTLTSLTVSGNSNLANINVSGGIVFANNNVSPDILVATNASNTLTRQLIIQSGNVTNALPSATAAGSMRIQAGNSDGSASATTWRAVGGSLIQAGGFALSNTGNATGGAYNLFGGGAQSLLTGNAQGGSFLLTGGDTIANVGRANGGPVDIYGGGGFAESGNTKGGDVTLLGGGANSNTSGTARGGNVILDVAEAIGVTSSIQGNIYIGTGTYSGFTPQVVSIGATATPTSIEGDLTAVGNITGANVITNSGGFTILASYTAAGLTAITGQIGWLAAVSDSAAGGNPNGMIAFWDTTNARWSYIHDNSAV